MLTRGPIVLAAVLAAPGAALAEDLVIFRDGQVLRVPRAQELPDRVRIETTTGSPSELPRGVPAEITGPRTVEVPRQEIRAVLPVPDPARDVRSHAERYGDITRQLTDQVRRDLQKSYQVPSGRSGSLPETPTR